jgi:hypothetical protein
MEMQDIGFPKERGMETAHTQSHHLQEIKVKALLSIQEEVRSKAHVPSQEVASFRDFVIVPVVSSTEFFVAPLRHVENSARATKALHTRLRRVLGHVIECAPTGALAHRRRHHIEAARGGIAARWLESLVHPGDEIAQIGNVHVMQAASLLQ